MIFFMFFNIHVELIAKFEYNNLLKNTFMALFSMII